MIDFNRLVKLTQLMCFWVFEWSTLNFVLLFLSVCVRSIENDSFPSLALGLEADCCCCWLGLTFCNSSRDTTISRWDVTWGHGSFFGGDRQPSHRHRRSYMLHWHLQISDLLGPRTWLWVTQSDRVMGYKWNLLEAALIGITLSFGKVRSQLYRC